MNNLDFVLKSVEAASSEKEIKNISEDPSLVLLRKKIKEHNKNIKK